MKKMYGSQLANIATYRMYRDELITMALNNIKIGNLPKLIDREYLHSSLLYKGSIAFFVDEALGLLALPYQVKGKLDIYNRPKRITCIGSNGYNSKVLTRDEFVIMYDNSLKYTIIPYLNQYAERLALIQRTIDINVGQQKTPRIIKAPQNQLQSVKAAMNNIDSCEGAIFGYTNFDIESIDTILTPAPYVSDKLEMEKEKIWNEAMRFLGIANFMEQKKERVIQDEVTLSQGGTIASRVNYYEPKLRAIEEIKEKFGYELELSYYDGLPSNLRGSEVSMYDLEHEGEASGEEGDSDAV